MRKALVAAIVVALAAAFGAGAAARHDYAAVARDILPPGNFGGINFNSHSSDQAVLYDALTPLFDKVTAKDVTKDFKAEPLWTGNEKAVRVEKPGRGVKILRDSFDVPHVFAKTEAAVFYGTGYAAAEDRGVLMELARYPGRLACIDAPGFNAFDVALSGKQFQPSAQSEAFLAKQINWLTSAGANGRQELADIDAYVAGINAQRKGANLPITPWTRNDVIATTCLLGARFGAGGGDETRRSELLAALEGKLGSAKGLSVFNDLREQNDPLAPTTLSTPFPYGPQTAGAPGVGNAIVDDASVQLPTESLHSMSNAVLVSAKRSTLGHPIMVAGPQLGYFYPEFFWEVDMEGGGVSVRGGSLAGIPNVLIGRGPDYGWSFTSSESDNIDTFAETLCGDDHHYLYKGACTAMARFDAGNIISGGVSTPVVFYETVHGPVTGYGTVNGTRVALSQMRSTRGRELKAALDVYDLSTGRLKSAQQFTHDLSRFEMSFNGFYVDSKHIAYVSCGRLPVRAAGVDPGFPTIGTGAYDWTGFLAPAKHPQAIDPASGEIVNWNNKPAPEFSARRRQLLLWRRPPRAVAPAESQARQELGRQSGEHDEQGGDPGPARHDRLARDRPGAREGRAAERARRFHEGAHGQLGAAGRRAHRRERGRQGRRPGRGDHRRGLAEARRRGAHPGARIDDRPARRADGARRQAESERLVVHRRVVRLRRQGSRQRPRRERHRALRQPLLRGRRRDEVRQDLWAALDAAGAQLASRSSTRTRSPGARTRPRSGSSSPRACSTTMRWTNRPTYQQILVFNGHR